MPAISGKYFADVGWRAITGTTGTVRLALHVDEPIERVVSRLAARGVRMAGGSRAGSEQGSALIEDPDGNPIELVEERALIQKAKRQPLRRADSHDGVAA